MQLIVNQYRYIDLVCTNAICHIRLIKFKSFCDSQSLQCSKFQQANMQVKTFYKYEKYILNLTFIV